MKNKKIILLLLGVITFLGILWLYNPTKEGLTTAQKVAQQNSQTSSQENSDNSDDEDKSTITAEGAKNLATSFQQQMAAAGIPQPSPSEVSGIFDQLTSLVEQEVVASGKAQKKAEKNAANIPVVNTVKPDFNDTTFFTGRKFADAFCKINTGKTGNPTSLNNKCSTLTSENCNATDCCIWANGAKCVAGNAKGPTFINGVSSDADYYSYKYKCYGNCGTAIKQRVYGNNGTVSCTTYCAGLGGASWNNELPASWGGAMCVKAGAKDDQDCNKVAGYSIGGQQCVCARNDMTPWTNT
jgi:hypothetical protein